VILLLGGTSDTAPLADLIAAAGFLVLVSTATDYPLHKGTHPSISHRAGPLDRDGLVSLIRNERIEAVVDATHPYAEAVSIEAREAARITNVPCLTFVRPAAISDEPGILFAETHVEAAEAAFASGEPVLLTIGANNLAPYAREAKRAGVSFAARILSRAESRAAALKAGVPEAGLIQAEGPFSAEENVELIRERGIRVIVTKDGGAASGVLEKLKAARQEGCGVIVVRRPRPAPSSASGANFSAYEALVEALMKVNSRKQPEAGALRGAFKRE
jgi:precorrin-6A/cobalt-precorrin-6A reductase